MFNGNGWMKPDSKSSPRPDSTSSPRAGSTNSDAAGSPRSTDKELVRRCQNEPAAFEELMRRYKRTVYSYARATTGSAEDAEEVTQDVFVKIYRAAHRFDETYSFTTWLYKITSNTCKNKLRGKHHLISIDDDEAPVIMTGHEATPLDVYSQKMDIAEVRNAIAQLPEAYREVLYLRYVQNASYQEIADALELSIGNVEARVFRGKQKVRQILNSKYGEAKRT